MHFVISLTLTQAANIRNHNKKPLSCKKDIRIKPVAGSVFPR